jgi:hypothetical protein
MREALSSIPSTHTHTRTKKAGREGGRKRKGKGRHMGATQRIYFEY